MIRFLSVFPTDFAAISGVCHWFWFQRKWEVVRAHSTLTKTHLSTERESRIIIIADKCLILINTWNQEAYVWRGGGYVRSGLGSGRVTLMTLGFVGQKWNDLCERLHAAQWFVICVLRNAVLNCKTAKLAAW